MKKLTILITMSLLFSCSQEAVKEQVKPEEKKETFVHPLKKSENNQVQNQVEPPVDQAMEDVGSDLLTKQAFSRPIQSGSVKETVPMAGAAAGSYQQSRGAIERLNTESYSYIEENTFKNPVHQPLSTFSSDVDAASYSNIRRFLTQGQWPYPDAVRIEEMINYFDYNYPEPKGSDPVAIHTELAGCPWNNNHYLLKIGLQAKKIPVADLPPANLTFLLDVSGSMQDDNKLPLVKSALKLLVKQLRPTDYVSIVVYAGAAGLVLPPTPGNLADKIYSALEQLEAGGSTAGGKGLLLAYETAQKNFRKNGINRIILATDGDFNVGPSSDGEMIRLIESKRKSGISISVLGFGYGNLKDSKMEQIADKGNGHFAYIDNLMEAKKVLVNEFGATLNTVATDVKIQVEWNPETVQGYRLVGYENRLMAAEDFNDDKKDAGDMGAGHTVTAFYEIIPHGIDAGDLLKSVDSLTYQRLAVTQSSNDWATVKFRYKPTVDASSTLLSKTVSGKPADFSSTSDDFRFAASVAGFGMILRSSPFLKSLAATDVMKIAKSAKGADTFGYRAEFIQLVELAQSLAVNNKD